MKIFFIAFNLLLLGMAVLGIITLQIETKRGEVIKVDLEKYNFVQIIRPSIDISGNYNTLFDIKPSDQFDIKSVDFEDKNRDGSRGLNQLNIGDKIVRVKGIFITEKQQSVAIEVIPSGIKNKRGVREIERKVTEDKIKDYTVRSIMPGYIVLSHPLSNDIILKIFAE